MVRQLSYYEYFIVIKTGLNKDAPVRIWFINLTMVQCLGGPGTEAWQRRGSGSCDTPVDG